MLIKKRKRRSLVLRKVHFGSSWREGGAELMLEGDELGRGEGCNEEAKALGTSSWRTEPGRKSCWARTREIPTTAPTSAVFRLALREAATCDVSFPEPRQEAEGRWECGGKASWCSWGWASSRRCQPTKLQETKHLASWYPSSSWLR